MNNKIRRAILPVVSIQSATTTKEFFSLLKRTLFLACIIVAIPECMHSEYPLFTYVIPLLWFFYIIYII